MSNENGTGNPSLIVYETKSGIVCHIEVINIATLRAIKNRAQEVYPYPDKADYPVTLQGSFISEELKKAAEIEAADSNPEYQKACRAVDLERDTFENGAILEIAVRFVRQHNPGETALYYTADELVNHFAGKLLKLRKFADLPEDDYEAVVWHCVFNGNRLIPHRESGALTSTDWDFAYVKQLAIQQIPLSHSEVMAGIRYFQYPVPGKST